MIRTALLLFFTATSILSAGLVEWIGYGGPGIFAEPPTEEDAKGIFFKQVQYRLRERGWDIVVPSDDDIGHGDVMVFINCPTLDFLLMHGLTQHPAKKILITWEPPTVLSQNHDPQFQKLFDRIITWNTKLIDGKRYLQYCYPVCSPMLKKLPSFHERHIASMIIADKKSKHPKELYSERRRIIDFYESNPRLSFHLYGVGWEKYNFTHYVSSPADKIEVLTHYRFSYAIENYKNSEGYITEKIFDCFQAGTVPIYLGATNITDFIPANCFIDARKFHSYKSLHAFLENMDEETWQTYQRNIRLFLDSPAAKRFDHTPLANAIIKAIFE